MYNVHTAIQGVAKHSTIHGQDTMPSEEYIRKEYIQEGGLGAVLRRIDAEYLIDLDFLIVRCNLGIRMF